MNSPGGDFWRQFDELESIRIMSASRRAAAFRQLGERTTPDGDLEAAWREYCDSVDEIDRSIAEIERLFWTMP
jgi:hypothetical protein